MQGQKCSEPHNNVLNSLPAQKRIKKRDRQDKHPPKISNQIANCSLSAATSAVAEVIAKQYCLQDLRNRGVSEIDLLVTDGRDGLLAAISALFPATLRKPCLVHKQRNMLSAIPKREYQEVAADPVGIWKQEKKEEALLNLAAFKAKYQKRYPEAVHSLCEDEEHLLTFYAFPAVMHRYIRSAKEQMGFFAPPGEQRHSSTRPVSQEAGQRSGMRGAAGQACSVQL